MQSARDMEIAELVGQIRFLEKAYGAMRIIDPLKKKVLRFDGNKLEDSGLTCHEFWKKAESCCNCVAMKAYEKNDTFIKMEYHQDVVFMVTAIPVTVGGSTVVVELLKDVTKNMLVVKRDGKDISDVEVDVRSIINDADSMLFKDHLTGLNNRRYIDERLELDIISSSLHKEPLSLIMADIDFFKDVNDTYGHLAGDYVLKEIAAILISCVRGNRDWVGRYGGEEFLICLPNTGRDKALQVAERMRSKIEEQVFEYEGKRLKLTTSFGVHSLENHEESSIGAIIGLADKNLYQAKQSGRNRVV